jgi:hypothetical protein
MQTIEVGENVILIFEATEVSLLWRGWGSWRLWCA